MTTFEFADTILRMPIAQQNAFFENLKEVLSEEDYLTTVKFVALYGMYLNPAKYDAIKQAVCDVLCEEFFGHTVELKRKVDDCNPVYMTTIV